MTINFVGVFNQPSYVGEISDETHLARELEKLGHIVRRIPRDAWREYVREDKPKGKYDVPIELRADINIIAKWHHFYDGSFVDTLKSSSEAPVFYWVWDFMWDQGFPDWHIKMAQAADLYLSGEAGIFAEYVRRGIKPYYFQMDVCDGEIPRFTGEPYKYNLVFTGSWLGQGNRIKYLQAINEKIPVTVFSWNHEEWTKHGFKSNSAVYGEEYNRVIAQSKVVLGMSVEPYCWGYWSNRVGKVLRAGGILLQEYAPGMEQSLPKTVEFFTTPDEAVEKAKKLLDDELLIGIKKYEALKSGEKFTSAVKAKQLVEVMERYLKGGQQWNRLP